MENKDMTSIVEMAMEILEDGNETYAGICLACSECQDGVEPDAEGYVCECCGEEQVMGVENILLCFGW